MGPEKVFIFQSQVDISRDTQIGGTYLKLPTMYIHFSKCYLILVSKLFCVAFDLEIIFRS